MTRLFLVIFLSNSLHIYFPRKPASGEQAERFMSPSAHAKEEGSQDPAPVSPGGSYTIRVSHIVLSHMTTS